MLEKLDRPPDVIGSSLCEEVTTSKVGLIGLGVHRSRTCQARMFLRRDLDLDLAYDGVRDITLQ
jgi:hypothetical protein